jgi:hypothetical protein
LGLLKFSELTCIITEKTEHKNSQNNENEGYLEVKIWMYNPSYLED